MKFTKEEQDKRIAKCISYLQSVGDSFADHFSPFIEGNPSDWVGSALHYITGASGKIYVFLFNKDDSYQVI